MPSSSFTLAPKPQFAIGSTVQVYPRLAFTADGSGPAAAAVTSAIVGVAGVTFTGLAATTGYWAAQLQASGWVKVAFTTAEIPSTGVAYRDLENVFVQPQQILTSETFTMTSGGAPLHQVTAGSSAFEVDEHGTVYIGPNDALVRTGGALDNHTALVDDVWDSYSLRRFSRMLFLRECANPPNLQMGRWPGVYPYEKGITTLSVAVASLGAGTLNLTSTAGFTGSDGDAGIGEAIIEEGSLKAHVSYTGHAANQLTGVVVIDGAGLAFTTAAVVSDALKADTTIGIIYGSAYSGQGGFRDRCAQIAFALDETARPDPAGSGSFYQAGRIEFDTSSPGPVSVRTTRGIIDSAGNFGMLGAFVEGSGDFNRKYVFAAPIARLRNSTKIAGGGITLPQATLTVRSTANLPASGTVAVVLAGGGEATVTYSGKTSTTLTGCSGGAGAVSNEAGVVAIFTLPVATLQLDDTSVFTNWTSGIVSIDGDLITYTGVDHATKTLTGCSGGAGTIRGDNYAQMDATSQGILLGVRGQISATDTGNGQTTIGNVGPAGEAGTKLGGGSGFVLQYRKAAGKTVQTGLFKVSYQSSNTIAFEIAQQNDAGSPFAITTGGHVLWGPEPASGLSVTPDVRLKRIANGRLAVRDATDAAYAELQVGKFGANGVTPPTQSVDMGAVSTTNATQTTPWGFASQAQAESLLTNLNAVRTCLRNHGLMA